MDKWTAGLKDLDPVQTRKRLADLLAECRFVSQGLEFYQGQGLRDQASQTERNLLKAAKGEIERLSALLAEYRSGPPPAPPPYDPYAAARERAAAKAAEDLPAAEPEPAPAASTRPTLPVRGARLPRILPGRPA
ncbi:hypothetical protein ABZT49_05890 [Methylobacterium sp. EM32]|uniref:hypothetical protein n=1 Tax=unclassified Methylobacterium TaxID=2615210 RepID=UPI0008E32958|nr:hypothetical protein [Methylobacterium sp. 174MFSha1.1]SFU92574.1 hypothetical protein SAMN02799631_03168 [Methylobacterium sp. 174MFSha1.1]